MTMAGSIAAPKHIFVLEDDPINRLLIEHEFEGDAYALRTAGDAATALSAFQHDPDSYEVGIFDLRVPSQPGEVPDVREALKVITAARSANPSMTIITISSIFISDDLREQLNRLNVGKVFAKPFSLDELHKFIDSTS